MEITDELDREDLLYLARLAEHCERYDEMVKYMYAFVRKEPWELSVEERNLLSTAVKNAGAPRRMACRVACAAWAKAAAANEPKAVRCAEDYRVMIETELLCIYQEALTLIRDYLLASPTNPEDTVFYYKMMGDYCRYICEYATGALREEYSLQSLDAYQNASNISSCELPPAHPIRLGLALNFSVFYYEILGNAQKGHKIAQEAFDAAIQDLDSLSEESYRDSTLIMQLLRDGLTLWTADDDSS